MSISEHISVFIAIIIGLAVGDLAMSFHGLMIAGKRVKWDWLSPLLAVMMLFVTVSYWWASYFWHKGAASLTIGQFLPDLVNVLILFLAVAATLPDEAPDDGIDLRIFYFGRARYLWTIQSLSVAIGCVVNLARNLPDRSLSSWLPTIAGVVMLCAFWSLRSTRKAWWHGTVIVAAMLISLGFNLLTAIG